jgi:Tfp pilus assembly protein PilF
MFSPFKDMAFVLLTPLPILLSFAAARRGGWMDGLLTFGLALAMAHYLPGVLRAYGDRALLRRYRLRLVLAPLFLISITTWFAYLNLHAVIFLALLWGQWHWMMQIYGFARIYDAKAEPEARTPARLDQAICLLWFGMCVFVLNNDLSSYVTRFYESGGPLIPPEVFVWLPRAWLALTAVVTIYYLVQTLSAIRSGRWPNPLKLVFIAVTLFYLRYTVSVMERPLAGLVMFESWHDIQYLAIVWVFNLNRARRSADAGSFIRFFFRPRLVPLAAYLGLCLIFGSLAHAWSLFENQTIVRIALSIVTSAGLLHYYLDGFIWKIRESETGEALGVRTGEGREAVAPRIMWPALARHAALWLLFAVPVTFLFVQESKGNVARPLQIYEQVAEAFPDSAQPHYQLGRELQDQGRLREAKVQYEKALTLAPNLLPAHVFLGVLLTDQRDLAAARPHFEYALRVDPRNAEVHNDLGIVLDDQGDPQAARVHLERAVSLDPAYALAHTNLGMVLVKLGDTTGAVQHLNQALRLDSDQFLAHNSLGELLLKEGKATEAKGHFEQALRINPGFGAARKNLAQIGK